MLTIVNVVANAIIFCGSIWALLSNKVPTRTGGSLVLYLVNFAAFGNIVSTGWCHSEPQVFFNVAIATAVAWAFWRLEVRARIRRHA